MALRVGSRQEALGICDLLRDSYSDGFAEPFLFGSILASPSAYLYVREQIDLHPHVT
jgi:hypothetical protein